LPTRILVRHATANADEGDMDTKQVRNVRLSDDQFFKIRNEEVLPQWETGKQIEDLDECIAAAKELSEGKSYARKFVEARERGIQLLTPQFGRALTEYMIEGLNYVEIEGGLAPDGMWIIFSDSYTRKLDFVKAGEGIERSRKEGMSMLNGWPIVNYGVDEARKIRRATQCPLSLNSTDEDGRLSSEIALAAGWNGANTRSIQECISHCKEIPLAEEIRINQYESRLAAIYTEHGVPICTHNCCNCTGYDTPSYRSFVVVSQSLLGAEQGIKQMFLEFGLNMSLVQDIALIRVTERLCREYCARFGYGDVDFFTGGYPYLGAWPPRLEEAHAMIAWNAVIPILAGCTTAILKSEDEAFGTPTKEGFASSVRLARHLQKVAWGQRLPDCEELRTEEAMIEMEVRALMEKCLDAADGDMARGLCLGVEAGWIDTMFSPWKHNKGHVVVMRDAQGAVRYWEPGDVPVPKEVLDFHKKKLEGRAKKEGRPLDFKMVIEDLQFASIVPKTNS
jgi:methylaspartate mutase epsilon subunit